MEKSNITAQIDAMNRIINGSKTLSQDYGESTRLDIQNLKDKTEDLTKNIEHSKKELITVLGIFASFITFVSVEFKFLDNVNSTGDFISMTLVLLSGMMFFVITLQSVIRDDEKFFQKSIFKLAIGLLIGATAFYALPRVLRDINENKYHHEMERVFMIDNNL
jgi:hypothetical protein